MPSNVGHSVSLTTLCLLIVLSGCGGAPQAGQPTDTPPVTDSPRQPTETLTVTTEPPSTTTDSPSDSTAVPTTTTVPRGGLLIINVVGSDTGTNASGAVRYERANFNRSPTLNDAITDAVSTNATQRRDLSGQEVRRVESVADAYNRSVNGFVVSKNGTVVRVSLAYEV